MKIIHVKQPWASAVVLGACKVINQRPRWTRRGEVAVCVDGEDREALRDQPTMRRLATLSGLALMHAGRGAILGSVEITDIALPDECQLEFARGPRVLVVHEPRVLEYTIHATHPGALTEVDLPDTITPAEFHRRRMQAATREAADNAAARGESITEGD